VGEKKKGGRANLWSTRNRSEEKKRPLNPGVTKTKVEKKGWGFTQINKPYSIPGNIKNPTAGGKLGGINLRKKSAKRSYQVGPSGGGKKKRGTEDTDQRIWKIQCQSGMGGQEYVPTPPSDNHLQKRQKSPKRLLALHIKNQKAEGVVQTQIKTGRRRTPKQPEKGTLHTIRR